MKNSRKIRRFSPVCFARAALIGWGLLWMAPLPAQEARKPAPPFLPPDAPPPTERPVFPPDPALLRAFFPDTLGDQPFQNEPVYVWFKSLLAFDQFAESLSELHKNQSRLLDETEMARRDRRTTGDSLAYLKSRSRVRELIRRLHENEQKIEALQERIKSEVEQLRARLPEIKAQLIRLREQWEAQLEDLRKKASDDPQWRFLTDQLAGWLEESLNLVQEIEISDRTAGEKIMRNASRLTTFRTDGRLERVQMVRRFGERIGKLEHEQDFLRQRLDANQRELEELKEQMSRLFDSRQGRPAAFPGETPETPRPRARPEAPPPPPKNQAP